MGSRIAVFTVLVLAALLNFGRLGGEFGRGIADEVRHRDQRVLRLRSQPFAGPLAAGALAPLPVVVLSDTSEFAVWLRHALYPRRVLDVPTRTVDRLSRVLPAGGCALLVELDAALADETVLAAARARVAAQLPEFEVLPVGPAENGLLLFEVRP